MGISTVGVIDRKNQNGEIVNEHALCAVLMKSLNEFIMKSYDECDIKRFEWSRLPVIRNRSRVDSFEYKPSYFKLEDGTTYTSNYLNVFFPVFVKEEYWPQGCATYKIKDRDDNIIKEAYNEGRTLHICPDSPDYKEINNSTLMGLNIGCWGTSKELITHLLKAVRDEFGLDTYYKGNDCSEDEFTKNPEVVKAEAA